MISPQPQSLQHQLRLEKMKNRENQRNHFLVSFSVQTPEDEDIPSGCWPFKFFRRTNKVTPISLADPIQTSSNTPTSSSSDKPTDEHLLKLFSTFSDRSKPNQDTLPSGPGTTKEEVRQEVAVSGSEQILQTTSMRISCRSDDITELDMWRLSTSSSEADETTKDADARNVQQYLMRMEKHPNLTEGLFQNFLNKRRRNNQMLYENNLKRNTTSPRGFPNIGNTCYMNSTLQSLLSLEDFFRSINCMKPIWSLLPEAQLLCKLAEIADCHTSIDSKVKTSLLKSFKKVVSDLAPEFSNGLQNDAHEFLITVLSQIQFLAPQLQDIASCLDTSYTCPVEENLVFRMKNTRTCKMCGDRSLRQETFTNLSLDLVPGGSIEEMLERYLMEVDLEFKCECGGKTSCQRSAFATLPRYLIIHLKRFRFTPSFNLEKINDPVRLQRELVVSSELGGSCYSLISAISHFGYTEGGHYISDGVHPEDRPDEPTDFWLTFNDSNVGETTGWKVCKERQESAYVLFYKNHL
ncbi:ubiquitin carboxyl-terminal hydrolase 37-like isoform X2 [Fundulus heteroclitus]|uniref:ubiquitin carboxyl-terminal hydrolase 37-like isoform X2 n=1 Tax=Fundulus heteroclitus TaxID=8078 RepID=UPI00165A8056|nr:ubiquitin carboxyl-terminal hydrolase 37-like isoform X2 [Fundulus heteroclitus]